MTSLVEKIMDADKAIRELYVAMIEMLNQEDMDYKIEFNGCTYDFWNPLTREEKEEMDRDKKEICQNLIDDAMVKLSHTLINDCGDSSHCKDHPLTYVWVNIANLQRATKTVDTISTIVSNEAYEVDEGTSKDLDYDSIYIQAQRKDLSDEEKWNVLLRGFVDKKSLARESDNSE